MSKILTLLIVGILIIGLIGAGIYFGLSDNLTQQTIVKNGWTETEIFCKSLNDCDLYLSKEKIDEKLNLKCENEKCYFERE